MSPKIEPERQQQHRGPRQIRVDVEQAVRGIGGPAGRPLLAVHVLAREQALGAALQQEEDVDVRLRRRGDHRHAGRRHQRERGPERPALAARARQQSRRPAARWRRPAARRPPRAPARPSSRRREQSNAGARSAAPARPSAPPQQEPTRPAHGGAAGSCGRTRSAFRRAAPPLRPARADDDEGQRRAARNGRRGCRFPAPPRPSRPAAAPQASR